MSSRAASTILHIGHTGLARVDHGRGDAATGVFRHAPRPAGQDLAADVRGALALGGKPRRAVWVLLEELFLQSITLSEEQVSNLNPGQIAQALAFEVEPFSGVPVADSVLAFQSAPPTQGARSFLLTQSTRAQRDEIQREVEAAGGRLAGILHPGGLPRLLGGSSAEGPRERYESWGRTTLHLSAPGTPRAATRVLPAPPRPETVAGEVEWLSTRPGAPPPPAPGPHWTLADPDTLREWLRAWAAHLAGGVPAVPVLPPAAAAASPHRPWYAGAAAAALAGLLGYLQLASLGREKSALDAQLAGLRDATARLEALKRRREALDKELSALDLERKQRESLDAQRQWPALMLRSLAAARTEQVVVRSITASERGALSVNGYALEAVAVDELGLRLTDRLRPEGWVAYPARKTARQSLANGGPWEFSLGLARADAAATVTAAPPPPEDDR